MIDFSLEHSPPLDRLWFQHETAHAPGLHHAELHGGRGGRQVAHVPALESGRCPSELMELVMDRRLTVMYGPSIQASLPSLRRAVCSIGGGDEGDDATDEPKVAYRPSPPRHFKRSAPLK